jgi:hypothetical protein
LSKGRRNYEEKRNITKKRVSIFDKIGKRRGKRGL